MKHDAGRLTQLNAIRDPIAMERIIVANSWTNVVSHDGPVTTEILRQLRSNNRPFVLRGFAEQWKVVQKWGDTEVLLSEAEQEEKRYPNRKYTVYKPEGNGHLNQTHAAPFGNMTLYKYLRTARKHSLYLLGVPDKTGRGASPFEMKKGESTPPLFADDLDNDPGVQSACAIFPDALVTRRHVFMNSDYSFTNLHYDTDWNMYLCVLGKRTWYIAHPLQAAVLAAANGRASYSTLQPSQGLSGLYPGRLAQFVKFVQVELEAGDVLFVPPTWWHVVEGMRGGFSCGVNFFHTCEGLGIESPLDVGWSRLYTEHESLQSDHSVAETPDCDEKDERGVKQAKELLTAVMSAEDVEVERLLEAAARELLDGKECPVLRTLLAATSRENPDWRLARQMLVVIVNGCLRERVSAEVLMELCRELQRILSNRSGQLGTSTRKRKNIN
jgi:hypothetical protein